MKVVEIFKDKKIKKLTIMGFCFYFVFLIFGIIFKFQYKIPTVRDEGLYKVTFSLVRDIKRISNGQYILIPVHIVNFFVNILLFIPLAVYLSLYKPNMSKIKRIIILTMTSVLIETIQFVFKAGVCDVYDVLLNSIGGIVGVFIYDKIINVKSTETIKKLIKFIDIMSIAFLFIAIIAAFYTTFVIKEYWK